MRSSRLKDIRRKFKRKDIMIIGIITGMNIETETGIDMMKGRDGEIGIEIEDTGKDLTLSNQDKEGKNKMFCKAMPFSLQALCLMFP
jgi:hypothetical protein